MHRTPIYELKRQLERVQGSTKTWPAHNSPEYGNEYHQIQPIGNQVQRLYQDCRNQASKSVFRNIKLNKSIRHLCLCTNIQHIYAHEIIQLTRNIIQNNKIRTPRIASTSLIHENKGNSNNTRD